MNITYLKHSGFSVELEKTILIFDYYTGGSHKHHFSIQDFPEDKKIFVFVSHAHSDHFDPLILNWAERVHYIVGFDVCFPSDLIETLKKENRFLQTNANQTYTFQNLKITTLLSNDEGVAFCVVCEGKTIYHSGDLNWWHWNGESEAFNQDIKASYQKEIQSLKKQGFQDVDVAFLPVDLRLADKCFLGSQYFLKEIRAKNIFPMHFWGDYSACDKLKNHLPFENIYLIKQPNESFKIK